MINLDEKYINTKLLQNDYFFSETSNNETEKKSANSRKKQNEENFHFLSEDMKILFESF